MDTRAWYSRFVRVVLWTFALGSGTALAQEKQHWMGEILLPNASCPRITFVVTLKRPQGGGAWGGTLSIPRGCGVMGVIDAPLKDVELTESRLAFATLAPNDNYYQAGAPSKEDAAVPGAEAGIWKGTVFIAQTQSVPIRVWRVGEREALSVAPRRPQVPAGDVPYQSHDVQVPIQLPAQDGVLAGTLTVPAGPGPFPAVVLVSDEEAQDRDHSDGTHKMFLVLADRLTRAGFAVLRTDDRGVGGSLGSVYDSTVEDTARDVLASLTFLRTQEGIDPARLGVIGYGEGALVGAMAMGLEPTSATGLVVLAPSGRRGIDAACVREKRQAEAIGLGEALTNARVERLRKVLEATAAGVNGNAEALQAALRDDMKGGIKEMRGMATPMTPDQVEMYVNSRVDVLRRVRMRSWLVAEPAAWYAKVACPTLVLAGALDVVAPAEDEVPVVVAALRSGPGAAKVESRVMPGVNHWMQPGTTGFPDEVDQIETTISEEVLAEVIRFLGSALR